MIKFFKTIFSTANHRIKNPLLGSFIFSWIIFNWKPIFYLLFAKDKMFYKISLIESIYENPENAIYRPLALSLFYVVIFPYVNLGLNWITQSADRTKRERQQSLDMERLKSLQELALEEKNLEDIRSGNKDISQLNIEKNRLTEELDRLQNSIQEKDKIISEYNARENDLTIKYQKLLKDSSEERVKNLGENLNSWLERYTKFFTQGNSVVAFDTILSAIEKEEMLKDKLPLHVFEGFIKENVIEKKAGFENIFKLTKKGEEFKEIRQYLKEKTDPNKPKSPGRGF